LAAQFPCKLFELEIKLNEYRKITVEPLVKEPTTEQFDPKGFPYNFGDKWSPGWC
jgi:hypothetical protein